MAVRRPPAAPESVAVELPAWVTDDEATFSREYGALYARLIAGRGSREDHRVRTAALRRRVALLVRDRETKAKKSRR